MPRIYSASTNISNVPLYNIEEYKSTIKRECTFYSQNGIFSLHKGNLVKHQIYDADIIQHQIGENKVAVDNSVIKKNKYFFQLPYGYVVQRTEIIEYKLCSNSEVKLVITFENNVPIDIYFNTKQDHTHPEVENTVSTFLSLLNFY